LVNNANFPDFILVFEYGSWNHAGLI